MNIDLFEPFFKLDKNTKVKTEKESGRKRVKSMSEEIQVDVTGIYTRIHIIH